MNFATHQAMNGSENCQKPNAYSMSKTQHNTTENFDIDKFRDSSAKNISEEEKKITQNKARQANVLIIQQFTEVVTLPKTSKHFFFSLLKKQ